VVILIAVGLNLAKMTGNLAKMTGNLAKMNDNLAKMTDNLANWKITDIFSNSVTPQSFLH